MTLDEFDDIKDPDAVLDYRWEWADWLANGETIDTVTWIVPDGLTEGDTTQTADTATVWLSGGTLGRSYPITCRITTNQNRTDDRTTSIRIAAR